MRIMIKTIINTSIIFLLAMLSTVAKADSFTLTGKVVDENGSPVELASVVCKDQAKMVMTDLKGDFTITLQSTDSVVVRFSMVGYKTERRVFKHPRGKQTIMIQLYSMASLGEVVVTEKRRQTSQTEQLDAKNLKNQPSVTGNAVEDLIQTQAGVSTHSELSSQYNVRGGSFDENSVYINNVEVYRPFLVRSGEQEGLSVINPDMVEKIGFSTGGFEAKYGDKMSSALDITYRRPTRNEAKVSLSLLGASAYAALAGKKFSWSNGIRYKTTQYLLNSLQTKGEYRPTFLDYQTYLSYRPNKRWTIDLWGNINDNHYKFVPENRETSFGTLENVKSFKVYFDGQEKDVFRTYSGTLNITRHIGDSTSISLISSAFSTNEKEAYDIQGQYWLTQTETSENLGVGTYMEHARNYLKANVESFKLMLDHTWKAHHLQTAFTYKIEHIDEQSREYEMRDSSKYLVPHTGNDLKMIYYLSANNKLNTHRIEFYAQDTWKMKSAGGSFYTLNYGLRLSHWSFNNELLASPRLSLAIIPAKNEDITWRFATGLYYQSPFFKELRDTTTNANRVTTATLNEKIKSQRSIHFVAAFDYRFRLNDRPFKFTAEGYFKALSNLIPYNVSNVKIVYYGENQCNGHAAGIDLKLYGEFVPGTDSWISFSWMNTRMNLNGKSLPLPTDQRYSVNLFFTDYFPGTERWKMSLKLAFADGLPFGPPHRGIESLYFRAPAYKRADIGMSYKAYDNEDRKHKSPFKAIWLGIDCLNLFGINNVNSYYWVTDVNDYQYAVPNYLTGRQINGRVSFEF